MTFQELWTQLDSFGFHDWGIRLETGHECAWSAELRITPHTNPSPSLLGAAAPMRLESVSFGPANNGYEKVKMAGALRRDFPL